MKTCPCVGTFSCPAQSTLGSCPPGPRMGSSSTPPTPGKGPTFPNFFFSFQAHQAPSSLRNDEFSVPYLQKGPRPQFFLQKPKGHRAWDKPVLL